MQTFHALYQQNPFWVWLAVGALFVSLDIAAGTGRLIWLGVAAAVVAFVNLARVRLGLTVEVCLFVAISALGIVLTSGFRPRRSLAAPRDGLAIKRKVTLAPEPPDAQEPVSPDRAGRLIGRIGRTTSEFVNGVGRVWIDGAEWGAEIDAGDDALPPDAPVRVMGITGGVRLQVRGLMG